eukprot:TRINITY_DN3137_c0_g1_i1.p1 TRINITY_DN3137_c0_g1~~TRINITY_DN3137_c0_g1_i1.p1  ORF type:complete len:254 (-),score=50.26 TRINITY_DN3137_c0_g1_i1:58-819(-)
MSKERKDKKEEVCIPCYNTAPIFFVECGPVRQTFNANCRCSILLDYISTQMKDKLTTNLKKRLVEIAQLLALRRKEDEEKKRKEDEEKKKKDEQASNALLSSASSASPTSDCIPAPIRSNLNNNSSVSDRPHSQGVVLASSPLSFSSSAVSEKKPSESRQHSPAGIGERGGRSRGTKKVVVEQPPINSETYLLKEEEKTQASLAFLSRACLDLVDAEGVALNLHRYRLENDRRADFITPYAVYSLNFFVDPQM